MQIYFLQRRRVGIVRLRLESKYQELNKCLNEVLHQHSAKNTK